MKFAKCAALALMLPGLAFGQTYPAPILRLDNSTVLASGASVGMNLPIFAARVLSVTDFVGADPTGVADSLAAFNAAQTQVLAAGGGTILVPAGTWKLSSSPTLSPGVNWQVSLNAIFPVGQLNGDVYYPQWSLFNTTAEVHPPLNTHYGYQFVVRDNVSGGETGVQEGVRVNVSSYGNNVVMGSGSHDVGMQVEATAALTGTSTQQLMIPVEAINSNPNSGTTVVNARGYYSKLVGNAGVITNYFGFYEDSVNTGTITNFYHYFVNPPTNSGTIGSEYAFYNNSTGAIIKNLGIYTNSTGQELAPTAATVPQRASRYFFGARPQTSAGTVTPGTGMLFAPWLQPGRGAIAQIGLNVSTPQAGATCSIGIFAPYQGLPGSVSFGPYVVSAASAGSVFATPSGLNLDAGLYFIGVTCSNAGVVLSAYTEGAATSIWGTGTPAGSDNMITSTSQTFATSPPITYVSNGALAPLLWVSQ